MLLSLGVSIDRQFDEWKLSRGEKEIPLFLLKGLSHKEVAELRSVADATVRQQARSAYQKAGVSGRYGLSVFFLEDPALPARNPDSAGERSCHAPQTNKASQIESCTRR